MDPAKVIRMKTSHKLAVGALAQTAGAITYRRTNIAFDII